MRYGKSLLLMIVLLFLLCVSFNFLLAFDDDAKKEQENPTPSQTKKSSRSYLNLNQAKSIGFIGISTAEEIDFLGSFYYYAPIFIHNNILYFMDYSHSVPLNKEDDGDIFNIDDIQFELKFGLKRFVRENLLLRGYYSRRSAIKVDRRGFANMDSLNIGFETEGFTIRNLKPDINWNVDVGFILRSTEPFKGLNIRGEAAIDITQISAGANMGVDLKLDSIISNYKSFAEGEAKFRINFFNRNGNITSLFASYLRSNHPFGLDASGFNFGLSWEHGQPPEKTVPPLSQWVDINGLFFLGVCNGMNGAMYVDLGADWLLAKGETWKVEANIQGWGWILTKGANNAFYTILGGTTLYYKNMYGFGFIFNHRSNHLIHQSISNPASSINYADFVAKTKGWHISNREYGLQLNNKFPAALNYFFSVGRVSGARFVDNGIAVWKYGARLDFPKLKNKITPFIKYYGERVGSYQQDYLQFGAIMPKNWIVGVSLYQDDQAYDTNRYFIVGIGKIY